MSKYIVIGLLLSIAKPTFSYTNVLDKLPEMNALPGNDASTAFDKTTTSCYMCIRNNYVWCSSKWNYEEPVVDYSYASAVAPYSAGEQGKCCFLSSTATADRLDGNKANVDTCPAAFSNAAGAAVVPRPGGTFWCSD